MCARVCVCVCVRHGQEVGALHVWLLCGISVVEIQMENMGDTRLGDHAPDRPSKDTDTRTLYRGVGGRKSCSQGLGWSFFGVRGPGGT